MPYIIWQDHLSIVKPRKLARAVWLFQLRCPKTCTNFLKLCKIKYYNFCLFHNVQKG